MTAETDMVPPAKCRHCQRPMHTPALCDFCETLQPVSSVTDHFALLGVPRRYDLDERVLHEAYLALARHAHPDAHVNDPPEVRALAQRVSAGVNEAYRTLSDPVRRAAYLLELLGGPASANDRSVPDGFLDTMMMLQEEVEELAAADDPVRRADLRAVLHTQHDGLLRRVRGLYGEMDQAAGCEGARRDLLGQLRRQLNAISYVRKLMTQV